MCNPIRSFERRPVRTMVTMVGLVGAAALGLSGHFGPLVSALLLIGAAGAVFDLFTL